MKKEHDEYLTNKYAPLYKMRGASMQASCMHWGFECGDGWFNIINTLSYMLCKDWLHAKWTYDNIIKDGEKYTTEKIVEAKVKMDMAAAKVPVAAQVKEKFGTLRFYVNNATDSQYELIYFAEIMSEVTCDVCGAPGTLNEGGWLRCRCEQHKDT